MRSLIALLFGCLCLSASRADEPSKVLTRIAFGSCAHQEKPQPIWEPILATRPELFLSLGDNIYGDTDDMAVLKKKYEQCRAVPGYQKLLKTCPILATWDDHDYGKNDAGVEYPKKDESQQIFLDFYGIAKDSPRRTQKGVYHAEIFGPPGKRVQVIVLDTRYFRSPLRRGKRAEGMTYTPYVANTDEGATILGETQWKWLEEQLKKPAEVRLLATSIQLVAEDHGFERWMTFPNEREKLFQLIRETKAGGMIALSGDRHLAELSMMEGAVGYPLYDLTSSGLNQASKEWRSLERNRHRVATMSYGDNFGLITIDWNAEDPKISLQIRDVEGDVTVQQKLRLSDLQPGKHTPVKILEQPTPTGGAISAKDALSQDGKKVTVEMRVSSVGGTPEKRIFLNSDRDFRSDENFAVVVLPAALKGRYAKAAGATFLNKVIRVSGTVSKFKGSVQILVEDEKQLEIVEPKKK
jgi:alkaline phosphatase D